MTAHELARKLLTLPDADVCFTGLYGATTENVDEDDVSYEDSMVYIQTDLTTG